MTRTSLYLRSFLGCVILIHWDVCFYLFTIVFMNMYCFLLNETVHRGIKSQWSTRFTQCRSYLMNVIDEDWAIFGFLSVVYFWKRSIKYLNKKLASSDSCAIVLRLRCQNGSCCISFSPAFSSVVRILPRHLRDLMVLSEISSIHRTLMGISPLVANIAFLEILKQWPLYGAVLYEVSVST